MRLRSENGPTLELTILGYEVPKPRPKEHNPHNDWLRAHVAVKTPRGSWDATGTPLLTTEVADLAFWLEAIATGGETGETKEFFEPLLYFEYRGTRGGNVLIRIGFGLAFIPPWAGRYEVDASDHCFDFEVTTTELVRASHSLRVQGEMFPFRPMVTNHLGNRN